MPNETVAYYSCISPIVLWPKFDATGWNGSSCVGSFTCVFCKFANKHRNESILVWFRILMVFSIWDNSKNNKPRKWAIIATTSMLSTILTIANRTKVFRQLKAKEWPYFQWCFGFIRSTFDDNEIERSIYAKKEKEKTNHRSVGQTAKQHNTITRNWEIKTNKLPPYHKIMADVFFFAVDSVLCQLLSFFTPFLSLHFYCVHLLWNWMPNAH